MFTENIRTYVPKKELFIGLPYVGMSSFCLTTRLQKSINSNISFCKIKFFVNHQHDYITFLSSKIIYLCVCARIFFISLRVVDAMLPVTAKLAVISKLELMSTQGSHL